MIFNIGKENKIILYIFGAGGVAKEILEEHITQLEVILVEDKPTRKFLSVKSIHDTSKVPIVKYSEVESIIEKEKDTPLHIAVNNGMYKKKISERFLEHKFSNLISPYATVLTLDVYKPIGLNVRAFAFISSTAKLGKHVHVNYGAKVTHNCYVGDYSFISINCSICGGTHIGKGVSIGAGVVVLDKDLTIGNNSVIGAGSVVTKDIPANVLAFGNPCKIIKEIL